MAQSLLQQAEHRAAEVKVVIDQSVLIFRTEITCSSGEGGAKGGRCLVLEALGCQPHEVPSVRLCSLAQSVAECAVCSEAAPLGTVQFLLLILIGSGTAQPDLGQWWEEGVGQSPELRGKPSQVCCGLSWQCQARSSRSC